VSLVGITPRVVWTNMVSQRWGKWMLGVTAFVAVSAPFSLIEDYRAEMAAVAIVSRPDSEGRMLIPAQCGVDGAELNRHFVVTISKAVDGRGNRSGCFYTVSAFKRFFPERYANDDPRTFRVQQQATGTQLRVPSEARANKFLLACVLGPFGLVMLGMMKSFADLLFARVREQRLQAADTQG
jgi:hypothetical protein